MTDQKKLNADELLQSLAFGQAAGAASFRHMCRVVHLPAGSWQARTIADADFVTTVTTPDALRAAVGSPTGTFIFIPVDAMIARETLDNACAASVLNKTIICEGEL